MRNSTRMLVVLITLLVAQPMLPELTGTANGTYPPSAGRAVNPPTNSTEWNISTDITIDRQISFAGNVTVFAPNTLRILGQSSLLINYNSTARWRFYVKQGAAVEIKENSLLSVDKFETESGAGLLVENASKVIANGVLNATVGSLSVTKGSTIEVKAPSGGSPGESGATAKLILNAGTGGSISQSKLVVLGGDGQSGTDGGFGGAGGDVYLHVTSNRYDDVSICATAGKGGEGGKSVTIADGGKGGRGGNLYFKMYGNDYSRSTFLLTAGAGGKGYSGAVGSTAGNGGTGGDGGNVDFNWTAAIISMASSNITTIAGNGGTGGNGGSTTFGGKNGGNGGDGGRGGTIGALIMDESAMTLTDSALNFWAGLGPSGGTFGQATQPTLDGKAGNGASGGSANVNINLKNTFTGTNSSIFTTAGNAGAGGLGTTGGKGGIGGTSTLNMVITPATTDATLSMKGRAFISRGGRGGDGGKGLKVGQTIGQPGEGGKGGGAKSFVTASKSIDLSNTEISCLEGAGGLADNPAPKGNPGVGDLNWVTGIVTVRNSTVDQMLGAVDENDKWTLESSPVLKPKHFQVKDGGLAEEYWKLVVRVVDITGKEITDSQVTVEVHLNDSLTATKKTDGFGKSDFPLLGARYDAAGDHRVAPYTVFATHVDGRYSNNISVDLIKDITITLILIEKTDAPFCMITYPDERIMRIIDMSQYKTDSGSLPLVVEGETFDSTKNSEQSISRIQVKISNTGEWLDVPPVFTPIKIKWNYTWDVYNWAVSKLTVYPTGVIPAPIYARSFNGRYWSDDLAHNGSLTWANITLKLLKIPLPLPDVEISAPNISTINQINGSDVKFEKTTTFNARIVKSYGTNITKYVWDFDDTNGLTEDYSSPINGEASTSYTREKANEYFFATLKIYDKESQNRVSLLQAGVSYDEFGYTFDTADGSRSIRIRIHVLPPVPPPPPNPISQIFSTYGMYVALALVGLLMMVLVALTLSARTKHVKAKKEKDAREQLRIEVADVKCARCGENLPDANKHCPQCTAQDLLASVQAQLLEVKNSGVSVSEAETLLESAVDAFDTKTFDDSIAKAQAARGNAMEMQARYIDTSTEISTFETKIASIKVDTPDADLTDAETKVYHARLALGRGDHIEAMTKLDGLDKMLDKASDVGARKAAMELIESTKRMIFNITKRGLVIDKNVEAALEQAKFAISHSEFELVGIHCKDAEVRVKDTNKMFMRAMETLRQGEAKIINAKGMGQSVGDCDTLLSQAKSGLKEGSYSGVLDLANQILGHFGIAPKPKPAADKKIDWQKEAGRLEGEDAPQPSAVAPETPRFVAPTIILEPEPDPKLKEAAEKEIHGAQHVIESAREAAVDITDGEGILEKAKEAYIHKRYEEAIDLSKSARYLLDEMVKAAPKKPIVIDTTPTPAAELTPEVPPDHPPAPAPTPLVLAPADEPQASIGRAQQLIEEATLLGADVSGPESSLQKAILARDGGSPEVATQNATDAMNAANEIIAQAKDAQRELGEIERVTNDARLKGLDTTDLDFHFKQAKAAFAGGGFGRVLETTKVVAALLKDMDATITMAPAPAPAPKPSPVPAPVPAPAPAAPLKCSGCGRDAKPTWKSCPFCGASMETPAGTPALAAHFPVAPPKEEKCPACGGKIKPGWTACPLCGTALVPDEGAKPVKPKTVLAIKKKPAVVVADVKPEIPVEPQSQAQPLVQEKVSTVPEPLMPDKQPEQPIPPVTPEPAPAPAPAAKGKCPGCGRDAKPTWKSCPFCGAAMGAQSPAPASVPASDPVPVITPKKPGIVIKPEAPQSGPEQAPAAPATAPVVQVKKKPAVVALKPEGPAQTAVASLAKCPSCGRDTKPTWGSCPFCGQKLK